MFVQGKARGGSWVSRGESTTDPVERLAASYMREKAMHLHHANRCEAESDHAGAAEWRRKAVEAQGNANEVRRTAEGDGIRPRPTASGRSTSRRRPSARTCRRHASAATNRGTGARRYGRQRAASSRRACVGRARSYDSPSPRVGTAACRHARARGALGIAIGAGSKGLAGRAPTHPTNPTNPTKTRSKRACCASSTLPTTNRRTRSRSKHACCASSGGCSSSTFATKQAAYNASSSATPTRSA